MCVSSSRHLTLHTRAHTSFHLLYSCHFSVWFRPLCVFSLPFPFPFFLLVGTGGRYEHLQCCRWWCVVPACAPFIDLCFSALLLYCRSSSSLIFFFRIFVRDCLTPTSSYSVLRASRPLYHFLTVRPDCRTKPLVPDAAVSILFICWTRV